ncbi:MAG: 23S rRNA (uracil(1939)-C(5))-methyltransferase RlmD [SAR86 cluster bacterium]|uniref:23S rRNA (uracil(1939)-C(5))-methyltransferase RlmD n=1 Tax=SAR86 cluster bacterium TaxID=2030880 RepID=A0A2A5C7T2_9GAMM|nr:MAG: 23S rRNA (uracil(1939)-C(5))-methyltransferase RlmD [SAR86 cluster bacterium]
MRRRRRQKLPTDPIVLNIEKLSHEGRGIAHLEGKVVFVEEALPGEQVSALYTQKRETFDQAKTTEVIIASNDRVEPPCQYASICGGCSLQHFNSEAQLAFKASVLDELLEHSLSGIEYKKMSPMTGPHFGYRRKARLGVRYVHKKEQVLVGFREKSSSFITNMDSCEVLDVRVSNLLPALSELIGSLEAYRQIPQIEVAVGDEQSGVNSLALVFRHLLPLNTDDLEKMSAFAESHKLDCYLQSGGPDTVSRHYPKAGVERLFYNLPEFELNLAFHPMDFTQVNAEINRKMISKAIELLALTHEDKVLDLFCGLGNFSLSMARRAEFVLGIEGSAAMVERGKENAQRMAINNVDFASADLTENFATKHWADYGFTKVLIDPPRSGGFEILPAVAGLKPEKIVYVSCNPITLARDAACLNELGYKLDTAGVMDMFPQTTHVESIALFIKS